MSLRKKALQRIDLQCLDVGIWEYHQGDDCSWDLGKVKSQYENIDEFRKLVDFAISRDTLKLEDVLATLNFRELLECGQKATGDGGEGLYVRGRSAFNEGLSQCYVMAYGVEELLDWIMDSGGSYHITYMRDYLVDFEEYDGGNILFGDAREMRNRGLVRFKYDEGWVKFRVGQRQRFHKQKYEEWESPNILGVLVTTGLNGLVKEINVTLLAKVVLYRNMGFNESGEYKKTFIGFGVGTGSVQVLQGVEFEVEPQEDHTFKVEPHRNVDHKAGLKDDMDARSNVYVLSNGCKECSDNSDGYYWEYTPAESGYKGLLDKAKGNVLGIDIIRDQRGNTLRVSRSRFYNGNLVQTLLEGQSILSLEGSLLRDCDVEKNGKWSCIYAVGSQEYQVVCTRLDIASADVGMLDKFDRGLQTDVQVFVDFDYTMGRSITVMGRSITRGCKGGYLAKRTRNRVRIRAKDSSGYCYRCLVKGYPWVLFDEDLAVNFGNGFRMNSHVTTAVLFDDEWKVSIRLVNTNEYNSEVLANIHIDIALDS
ncbi:hypothetical protein Tco_0071156 [Tanacetum coccineum]